MNENIGIFICYHRALADLEVVRQLELGIEEEGIPHIVASFDDETHYQLAEKASSLSQLEVGFGVSADGRVCLHQGKLPEGYYLFDSLLKSPESKPDLRSLGANGARLVKGMPFKAV